MSLRPAIFAVFIALLALCAAAMLNSATPAGAGLANDSAAYIAGARSILQGRGYSDIWLDSQIEAITHYPPLLSLALAALGLLKIDPLRGARILNILLFGANTALMGLLGWRMTRSQAAGLWLAALFMLNASLLRIHVYALSEPLYLFLSLLSFLFIDLSLTDPLPAQQNQSEAGKKTLWLALAGVTTGLAILTRYSALALLPTFVIALALLQSHTATKSGDWQSRLKAIAVYLAGAIPPVLAWFVRNKLVAGNATNRSFQVHPVTAENIQPGFYNIAQFLLPVETWQSALIKSGWLAWLLAGLGLVLFFWLALRTRDLLLNSASRPQPLSFTTVLYMFGYLGAVLFSMSFFDASTKFQPRILAPLYVALMLLAANGVNLGRKPTSRNIIPAPETDHATRNTLQTWLKDQRQTISAGRILVLSLAIITLAFSTYGSLQSLETLKQAGLGYASWKWHDSLVMASLRELPPGMAIYTNTPPAVYLVTGRASRVLPTAVDPVDNLPRAAYEQDMAQMRADLLAGKAVLALFDTSTLEDALGTQNLVAFVNGLGLLQKAQGDLLYGKP